MVNGIDRFRHNGASTNMEPSGLVFRLIELSCTGQNGPRGTSIHCLLGNCVAARLTVTVT